jgi:methionyl-tRNA synthetase
VKSDPERGSVILRTGVNLARLFADLAAPIIPETSTTLLAALGAGPAGWPTDVEAILQALPAGHAFTVPDLLFRKLTDEEIEQWTARFGGGIEPEPASA